MYQAPGSALARRAAPLAVAVLLALVAVACGSSDGTASAPTTRATTATTVPAEPSTTLVHGAPRWESLTTLKGTGKTDTAPFTILKQSIQWRARWTCEGQGPFRIDTDPPPSRPKPLAEGTCPGKGEGFGIVSGEVRLKIEAPGPWTVVVDQQVDTPLKEPPFEGMGTAQVVRQGTFSNVEKMAKGTARLYQRPDGVRFLRLENFEVTTNVDLFVWLSETPAPKTSAEAVAAPHVVLGNLKSTLGDQNYTLPADVPPDKVKSIVIWCEPVRIAYGAAALT